MRRHVTKTLARSFVIRRSSPNPTTLLCTSSAFPLCPISRIQGPETKIRRHSMLLDTMRWWSHAAGATIKQFRLAQTGEGIKECELIRWFVNQGDPIEKFSRICEVQSDKATVEITSPYNGTVHTLHHHPGDMVQVGDVLADIHIVGGMVVEGGSKEAREAASGADDGENENVVGRGNNIFIYGDNSNRHHHRDSDVGVASSIIVGQEANRSCTSSNVGLIGTLSSNNVETDIKSSSYSDRHCSNNIDIHSSKTTNNIHHKYETPLPYNPTILAHATSSNTMHEASLQSLDAAENGKHLSSPLSNIITPSTNPSTPTASRSLPNTHKTTTSPPNKEGLLASPAARYLARQLNVDLYAMNRDGPGTSSHHGRGYIITKEDVLLAAASSASSNDTAHAVLSPPSSINKGFLEDAHLSSPPPPPPSPPPFTQSSLSTTTASTTTTTTHRGVNKEISKDDAADSSPPSSFSSSILPLRGYRRAMVKSMTAAAMIPHFHLHEEIRVDELVSLRRRLRDASVLSGAKLTYLPFFIKASALALREHPLLNSSLSHDGNGLIRHGRVHIGVAIATPHGLAVPNIKDVDTKSVATIAQELNRLQTAATSNQLSPHDVTGATFTMSNIGSIGGTYSTPLVNLPEAAIMALGRIQQVPRLGQSDGVSIDHANILCMSLGADHRVVDGAALASFTRTWKTLIEDPGLLLLHLK